MKKGWIVIEKFIAFVILVWGLFVLYSVIHTILLMNDTGYFQAVNVTVPEIIRQNHLQVIFSIVAVFGGVSLLFKDTAGWYMCILASLFFAINLSLSARIKNTASPVSDVSKSYAIAALVLIIFSIILLLKPIRSRYNMSAKNWIWLGVFLAAYILDRILLF